MTKNKKNTARISASVFTSHIPAIANAIDCNKTGETYWQKVFEGYDFSRNWIKKNKPDVIFLIYNDHANAFGLDIVPTFAIGTDAEFAIADEGTGVRAIPKVIGHPDLAAHIAQELIQDDFDLTIANKMEVDHGLTVPLSLMFGEAESWPSLIIPFAVNVIQHPAPSGKRCFKLGKAIRKAIESYEEPLNVQIWGTGGMSHQLQGKRAGLINQEWDNKFLDLLISDPQKAAEISHVEYFTEAGSEAIELVMWLIARGAMSDVNGGNAIKLLHRFYHVPVSNSALGHLILEN